MNKEIRDILYKNLPLDKIKIHWNKNPINMSLFLSFLKVEVIKNTNCLGSYNGWIQYRNDKLKLIIDGGVVNDIELLDSLQFGTRLDNPHNNCVNPFYIFDILTEKGQAFFVDYYKDEFSKLINTSKNKIECLESQWNEEMRVLNILKTEVNTLQSIKQ